MEKTDPEIQMGYVLPSSSQIPGKQFGEVAGIVPNHRQNKSLAIFSE